MRGGIKSGGRLREWTGNYRVENCHLPELPLTLGALLALLVGFNFGSVGAMVFCDFVGRSEGGDLGMRPIGLGVGVGKTGTAVGRPCTTDGATDGTLEGPTVSSGNVG